MPGYLIVEKITLPSLRVQRSNPAPYHDTLDCFATLAMTGSIAGPRASLPPEDYRT